MPAPAHHRPGPPDAARPQGLIVDFAGVLTTSMQANGAAFEQAEGLVEGALGRALREAAAGRRAYAALEEGRATQQQWNTVVGGLLGIDPHNLMGRLLSRLRAEETVLAAVRRARTAGTRTALLSNSFGAGAEDVYERLGALEPFDVVVLSEREGIRKPAPEIYRRTLHRLSLPAPACVFVDDTLHNLQPARALGIRTVHHTHPADTVRQLEQLFDST
ncbi:HAD family hydrolase [Streptacidiphilus albus]|uniref:HAD family hydrolase n=1 Tax=Streptacidiphilus albus TaxID=105425 RepID=UPI0005A826DF|nr:HAD-IA family hydrolase [Streptacidiphilus albus]